MISTGQIWFSFLPVCTISMKTESQLEFYIVMYQISFQCFQILDSFLRPCPSSRNTKKLTTNIIPTKLLYISMNLCSNSRFNTEISNSSIILNSTQHTCLPMVYILAPLASQYYQDVGFTASLSCLEKYVDLCLSTGGESIWIK